MKKKVYITIAILALVVIVAIGKAFISTLSGMGNPTGGKGPDYPYFYTTQPTVVKKIIVPKGTKLTYEEHFFKKGHQNNMMNEEKLTSIKLPEGKTIDWGGVPIYMIIKFFNPEMQGYSVYADFKKLSNDKKTKFSELWNNCKSDLGVLVKNPDEWTFSTKNIIDISSCSVNNQRYFKEDKEQQQFLDSLFNELKKVNLAL